MRKANCSLSTSTWSVTGPDARKTRGPAWRRAGNFAANYGLPARRPTALSRGRRPAAWLYPRFGPREAYRRCMSALESPATATATDDVVLVRRDGPAARRTLNRPARRNALSLEVMHEPSASLKGRGEAREVRAIVVEGAGPAFCAGHDLSEMVDRSLAFYQRAV